VAQKTPAPPPFWIILLLKDAHADVSFVLTRLRRTIFSAFLCKVSPPPHSRLQNRQQVGEQMGKSSAAGSGRKQTVFIKRKFADELPQTVFSWSNTSIGGHRYFKI
jgi:hypothetical protein